MTLLERPRRLLNRTSAVTLALVAIGVTLLAGFGLKSQCLQPWDAGVHQSSGCYNDLQQLYDARGTAQGVFPYVSGDLVEGQLVNGAFEYPVLTGLFTWLPGALSDSRDSYFVWSMLLLAPFGVYAAWALGRLAGRRALIYAASPVVIWYAFLNWDLLAVAATVAAVWCFSRNRFSWAAFWLAIGGCLKLYPAIFLLPLVIYVWRRRSFGDAFESACIAITTAALVNVPFYLANPDGWLATFEFQKLREADLSTNTIWFWAMPQFDHNELNIITPILMAISWAAAVGYGLWRMRREGDFPFLQVCAAMLCAFMLWNKVHSPQYGLWLPMFFALVRIRWGWWVTYAILDTMLFWGVFRWHFDLAHRAIDFGTAKQVMLIGMWGNSIMLALLFVVFLRSGTTVQPPADPPPDDPANEVESERRPEPVPA